MTAAVVTVLIVGFGGLIVLFAPFSLSGQLSEQEHGNDVAGEEGRERQDADDSFDFVA